MSIKKRIKNTLFKLGYVVRHVHPDETGYDPFKDMSRLTNVESGAVLFDVGANIGQTVALFREYFKCPVIHSFEPSPSTFEKLQAQTRGLPDLHLNNVGLGSHPGQLTLHENVDSTVSSFLSMGKDFVGGREMIAEVRIDVDTVDDYCSRTGVTHIDVLKTDAQGFDYEVLKGASEILRQHRVHLIFIELQVLDSYVGGGRFEDTYRFLKDVGFLPMAFYKQTHHGAYLAPLAEIDGLFIDPKWKAA